MGSVYVLWLCGSDIVGVVFCVEVFGCCVGFGVVVVFVWVFVVCVYFSFGKLL